MTYANAEHALICRHCIGDVRLPYSMRCHILKVMPDGLRFKVLVFGYRAWGGLEGRKKSRIRYVPICRVKPLEDVKF